MKPHLFLALLFLTLVGCVTQPVKEIKKRPEHNPPLRIGQNGDGSIVLEWDSDANYLYTIYVCKKKIDKKNIWKELPHAIRIQGTGKMMVVHDKTLPHAPMPRYRLYFEEIH